MYIKYIQLTLQIKKINRIFLKRYKISLKCFFFSIVIIIIIKINYFSKMKLKIYKIHNIWIQLFLFCLTQTFLVSQIMALGNQVGRIFIWDLDVDDPTQSRLVQIWLLYLFWSKVARFQTLNSGKILLLTVRFCNNICRYFCLKIRR